MLDGAINDPSEGAWHVIGCTHTGAQFTVHSSCFKGDHGRVSGLAILACTPCAVLQTEAPEMHPQQGCMLAGSRNPVRLGTTHSGIGVSAYRHSPCPPQACTTSTPSMPC